MKFISLAGILPAVDCSWWDEMKNPWVNTSTCWYVISSKRYIKVYPGILFINKAILSTLIYQLMDYIRYDTKFNPVVISRGFGDWSLRKNPTARLANPASLERGRHGRLFRAVAVARSRRFSFPGLVQGCFWDYDSSGCEWHFGWSWMLPPCHVLHSSQ